MGKFFWFLLGVSVGATAVALMRRVEEEKEIETFEEVAQSLQERLETLEGQFGTSR